MPYLIHIFSLFLFWLLLSGHTSPLLLVLGALSAAASVGLSHRAAVATNQPLPISLHPIKTILFIPILAKEVFLSSLAVAKAVISINMRLNLQFTTFPNIPKSTLGKTAFANSVTLTPGTVAVHFPNDNSLLIHSLVHSPLTNQSLQYLNSHVQNLEKS